MKNLTLTLGTICFFANIIIGLVLTPYTTFNVTVNSIVIAFNTLLMYFVVTSSIKDGFKFSLSLLFPMFALAEFVLGIMSPNVFENNWYVVVITIIMLIKLSLYAITRNISKS